jgi:hypothetical protein
MEGGDGGSDGGEAMSACYLSILCSRAASRWMDEEANRGGRGLLSLFNGLAQVMVI